MNTPTPATSPLGWKSASSGILTPSVLLERVVAEGGVHGDPVRASRPSPQLARTSWYTLSWSVQTGLKSSG